MAIRTFDAVPMGTVPGANLVQLNDIRGAEGELCLTEDYKKVEHKLTESERYGRQADITIENLERKLEKLAAENAGLKSSRAILAENTLESCNAIASAGFQHEAIMRGLYKSTGNSNKYPKPITTLVNEAIRKLKTPATDAFLAEVRAQGVEMYAEHLTRKAIESGENKNHAYAYLANNFAAQLRKGAAL